MARRPVELRLAPLDVPARDGRKLRGEGPWRVRAGGAPIFTTAGEVVGIVERVSVADGWLVGAGAVDEHIDLAAVAPQFDLGDFEIDLQGGWRVFLHGRVDRVVLFTNPAFAEAAIMWAAQ